MPSSPSLTYIERTQAAWSRRRRLELEARGYVKALSANLLAGELHPETQAEFQKGDGAELKDHGVRPAKMRALMSSSALAVNFFDAWRDVPKLKLGEALGLPASIDQISFEYRCSNYPVKPRSPNLDLMLTLSTGARVAVESKFSEPFRSPGSDALLSPKYFRNATGYWAAAALPRAQHLAESLKARWHYLDAAQLLKHLLGLASEGHTTPVVLLYLWYDTGLPDAARHDEEVKRFADKVSGEKVSFISRTYQATYASLGEVESQPSDGWRQYLSDRYFPGSEAV